MRNDLNKLLCERERPGSSRSFKDHRNDRNFKWNGGMDPVPTRESMTKRYKAAWDYKEFNENFNPLFGMVRKNANRPWDKVYSELCRNFNMSSVINQHILTHLFDFVETKTKMVDGIVHCHNTYNRHGDDYIPLKNSYCEYYVHPVDGLLKRNKFLDKKPSRKKTQELRKAEKEKNRRKIRDDLYIHLFDNGQWYYVEYAQHKWYNTPRVYTNPDGSERRVDYWRWNFESDIFGVECYPRWYGPKVKNEEFIGEWYAVKRLKQLNKIEMNRFGVETVLKPVELQKKETKITRCY